MTINLNLMKGDSLTVRLQFDNLNGGKEFYLLLCDVTSQLKLEKVTLNSFFVKLKLKDTLVKRKRH